MTLGSAVLDVIRSPSMTKGFSYIRPEGGVYGQPTTSYAEYIQTRQTLLILPRSSQLSIIGVGGKEEKGRILSICFIPTEWYIFHLIRA
jgi:hypothetical protein